MPKDVRKGKAALNCATGERFGVPASDEVEIAERQDVQIYDAAQRVCAGRHGDVIGQATRAVSVGLIQRRHWRAPVNVEDDIRRERRAVPTLCVFQLRARYDYAGNGRPRQIAAKQTRTP